MRFNGVELTSVHRALSIEKEIPPGTAGRKTETIETADGEVVTEERLVQGEYVVRVNILGKTRGEGWEVRELLAKWASVRGLKSAQLVPTHRPNRYYEARLKSISEPEFVHRGAKVEVRFMLPRPVMLDMLESVKTGAGEIRAEIRGTYACRPVIRQTMREDRDGLTWEMDGGKILTITGALTAGQEIEMDTVRGSLTIDGEHAEGRIDVSGTKWRPGYEPGTHKIRSSDGGGMEMRWRNEWL